MYPHSIDVVPYHAAPQPWLTLCDLFIATTLVVATAMIGSFILLASAPVQVRGVLRVADTFFERKLVPNAIKVGETVAFRSPRLKLSLSAKPCRNVE